MDDLLKPIALLKDKLVNWLEATILMAPNVIIACVVFALGIVIAKFVSKMVKRILSRSISNHALVNFLTLLTKIVVITFGFLLAIDILKLDEAVLSILAGVGIVGVALGFAFQDVAANFISGIALVLRKDRPFKKGDIVETNDYLGVVEEINLRATLLRTFTGQAVLIPNKMIFEEAVTNYTLLGGRRVDLAVGVSYGDDLEKVKKITLEAIKGIAQESEGKKTTFIYDEFGASSINFKIRFWIEFKNQIDFLEARSQAIMRIKKAFDENDIMIPFPIRTLDFGIRGGEKLSSMIGEWVSKG